MSVCFLFHKNKQNENKTKQNKQTKSTNNYNDKKIKKIKKLKKCQNELVQKWTQLKLNKKHLTVEIRAFSMCYYCRTKRILEQDFLGAITGRNWKRGRVGGGGAEGRGECN